MKKKALLVGIDAYPAPNTLYECISENNKTVWEIYINP
jgi:hypothetical protein